MALSTQDKHVACRYWANSNFVTKQVTANYSIDDLLAAATTMDNGFDMTINAAQAAGFGAMTLIQAISSNLAAPFSGASGQQKAELACAVLLKRANLI